MNMELYNQVKAMLQNGKSLEDVQREIYTMAQTAEKEIQPQTPIADYFTDGDHISSARTVLVNPDGRIDPAALQFLTGAYFVQNGFKVDTAFSDIEDYRKAMKRLLDQQANAFEFVNKISNMEQSGASDEDMLHTLFDGIGQILKEALVNE